MASLVSWTVVLKNDLGVLPVKKLTVCILILAMLLSFSACAAANLSASDVKALEEQILADKRKEPGYDNYQFREFHYLGTDNGYHIVWYSVKGYELCDAPSIIKIKGYEFMIGGSWYLEAYKDGELIDLRLAYKNGLISDEAIAKAAELDEVTKRGIE